MAMYAVEADRWECEAWPRYIVAKPLLKLLSVLLLSGNVGPRKRHFREIGRGCRKYIYIVAVPFVGGTAARARLATVGNKYALHYVQVASLYCLLSGYCPTTMAVESTCNPRAGNEGPRSVSRKSEYASAA